MLPASGAIASSLGGAADLDTLGQTGQVTVDAFAIEPLPAFFRDV